MTPVSAYWGEKAINDCIKTKMVRVHIESELTLNRIQDLIFSSDFTFHGQYRSIFTRKSILENIVNRGGSVNAALLNNKTIIGLTALDYPDTRERWANLGDKIVMELKAVEVLREFRKNRISRHLLSDLFSNPELEDKIVYLTGYSWTWDLDYSGLSVQAYRNILFNLYADFGFVEYLTNEPNICLKSENLFMVRVGKNIPQKRREEFKWLRFGLSG